MPDIPIRVVVGAPGWSSVLTFRNETWVQRSKDRMPAYGPRSGQDGGLPLRALDDARCSRSAGRRHQRCCNGGPTRRRGLLQREAP